MYNQGLKEFPLPQTQSNVRDSAASMQENPSSSDMHDRSAAVSGTMRESFTIKQYDVWSWFYDHTFGALVRKRQRRAVDQLRPKPGDRILDLGVGTGMTLRHYPKGVNVVGVDLSMGMLKKAARKRDQLGMKNCDLIQCDAMMPPFAFESFDHVLITHVISVVSNPPLLLEWAGKLVKPGGRIVLLNHFQSTKPMIAWVEKVLNPIFLKIGWKSDLPLEDVLRGCELNVDYIFKTSVADIWRVIVLTKKNGNGPKPEVIRGEVDISNMQSNPLPT